MTKKQIKTFFRDLLNTNTNLTWILLAGIVLFFSFFLYPGQDKITRHQYSVGDIAKSNIKAPREFLVEDPAATDLNIKQAKKAILTVYDYDSTLHKKMITKISSAFAKFREIIQTPVINKSDNNSTGENKIAQTSIPSQKDLPGKNLAWVQKDNFENLLGAKVSKEDYVTLVNKKFSKKIELLIAKIISKIMVNGVVANKSLLLKNAERGVILKYIDKQTERIESNLKKFYGLDQGKKMVRIIADPLLKDIDYSVKNTIVNISQELIHPNITVNSRETEQRKQKVAKDIAPVLYKVKAGEMLLREGEIVTRIKLLKLESIKKQSKNKTDITRASSLAILISLILFIIYFLDLKPKNEIIPVHNKNMLFLTSVLLLFLLIASLSVSAPNVFSSSASYYDIPPSSIYFGIPFSAAAMTVCVFMGFNVAATFIIIFSILVTLVFSNQFTIFLYTFISSLMAAHWISECRERKVFVKAGLKTACLNVILAAILSFYLNNTNIEACLWSIVFAFSSGIIAGIITAGLAPLLEMIFDFTTDIKLLELANLEQPILRRMMIEAPGTYNHSVLVGTLADAVASEIGANSLLARVCGYYHDIGKLDKPQYFIENQKDGRNKHDKLAPSMSALIITGHVKSGVSIAKQYRLGKAIIDTIKQHHGNSLLEFFFEKAKVQKMDSEETVNEDDFRYPGPHPQTIEAAIVMIADVTEAATRTLEDPTPSRIQGLVQKLINKIFADGQLDYCEITLKDLHNIAKRLNKVLSGIHHHRIKYPEKQSGSGKEKNGNSDNQQTGQNPDADKSDSGERENHLKRLGIT